MRQESCGYSFEHMGGVLAVWLGYTHFSCSGTLPRSCLRKGNLILWLRLLAQTIKMAFRQGGMAVGSDGCDLSIPQ